MRMTTSFNTSSTRRWAPQGTCRMILDSRLNRRLETRFQTDTAASIS